MKVHLYRDCSDLPIYNFDQIIKNNEYSYLVVGYDGYNKVDFDMELAQSRWAEIYNQYCVLSDDNATSMFYALIIELNYLKTRKYFVTVIVEQLKSGGNRQEIIDKFINSLGLWGYHIDKEKPLEEEILKVEKKIRGSNNRIELKQSEIESMTNESEGSMSLTKQVVKLEQGLGRENIDPKKTSVEKWLELLNELKAKIEREERKNAA